MTELAAQLIRRATSFRDNFAPSSLSARLRRSESSSAEPFGRMGTSYRQEVHYCIILCEINKSTEIKIFATVLRGVILAKECVETPGGAEQKLKCVCVRIETNQHVHLFMSDWPLGPTNEALPTLKEAGVIHRGALLQ